VRRFFQIPDGCAIVKVVYCDHCQDVSIKSRLEKDVCNRCGRGAVLVPYSRPWQYYASSGVLLGITVILLAVPLPDLLDRIVILLAGVAVALALTAWSLRSLRERAIRKARARKEAEP